MISLRFIAFPSSGFVFDTPTTVPARSNEKPFPANMSGIIAVSPPTIGVPLIFAPFASPLAICKNIFESLRFAAI